MISNPGSMVVGNKRRNQRKELPPVKQVQFDVTMRVYVCFKDDAEWEEMADWIETNRMFIFSCITHPKARRHVNSRKVSVIMHEADMETIKEISIAAGHEQYRVWNNSTLPYTFTVSLEPYSEKQYDIIFQMMRCALAGRGMATGGALFKRLQGCGYGNATTN